MKNVIILDRDGTMIVDKHFLKDPQDVELEKNALDGLLLLTKKGFRLVVISNQSGIGRGYFTTEDAKKVNAHLANILANEGVKIENFYFCPHAPAKNCACRKPKVALAEQASKELEFKLSDILCVIGDKEIDLEFAQNLGTIAVLVKTGYGAQSHSTVLADIIADDLLDAANKLCACDVENKYCF